MSNQKQAELERVVLGLTETLRNGTITVENFNPVESQSVLFDIINKVISSFRQLETLRSSIDIEIPYQVLDYIDKGSNPELYTHDLFEQCIEKNEATKGKIEAFETFRNALVEEISSTFPNEYKEYLKIKGDGMAVQRVIKTEEGVKVKTEEVKVKTEDGVKVKTEKESK